MNLEELRLAVNSRFGVKEELINKINKEYGFDNFILTLGKAGSLYVKNKQLITSPGFVKDPIDTVGAGDAVFSLGSLLAVKNLDPEIIVFLSNCSGAVASNIVGNKEPVDKKKLINFINKIYSW